MYLIMYAKGLECFRLILINGKETGMSLLTIGDAICYYMYGSGNIKRPVLYRCKNELGKMIYITEADGEFNQEFNIDGQHGLHNPEIYGFPEIYEPKGTVYMRELFNPEDDIWFSF